jgi:hypothetical protein
LKEQKKMVFQGRLRIAINWRKVVLKILHKCGPITEHTTELLDLIFELMTINCGIKVRVALSVQLFTYKY